MKLADYSSFDGVALAELVRKREVTPKELAHSFVEAVEKVNPRINAVIEVSISTVSKDWMITQSLLSHLPGAILT